MKKKQNIHRKKDVHCCTNLIVPIVLFLTIAYYSSSGAEDCAKHPRWHKNISPYGYLSEMLWDYDIIIQSVTDTIEVADFEGLFERIAQEFRVPMRVLEGKQTVGDLLTGILGRKYPKRHTEYNDFMKIRFSSQPQDFYKFFERHINTVFFEELVEKYYALSLYKLWYVTQKQDDTISYLRFLKVYEFYSSFYCETLLGVDEEECAFHHSQYEGYDRIPACLFAKEARRRLEELNASYEFIQYQ